MCNCKIDMDIRGRCCPILNNADFLKCRARQDTALIHFENDYESYKKLEASIEKEENLYPIFVAFLSKFGLPRNEILMIANAWKVAQEEMMEDEEEEEEEEEEKIEPATYKCFKCSKECQMSKMYYKNNGFYCSLDCYIDLQMKMYETNIEKLKKPSVQDILKSLKKN